MRPKIVFLYTEVADYFLAGVTALSNYADVLIVRWSVKEEAPFDIQTEKGVELYEKSDFSDYKEMKKKVLAFQPDLVVCSGWMDKEYLKIIKKLKKAKKIVTFDNHWSGSFKQKLATKFARKTILSSFDKAWVPGTPQIKFARKLGFLEPEVEVGFYCANSKLFIEQYETTRKKKWEQGLPKRFLYVGRYVRHKGIFDLWKAFISISEKHPDWELWCVGTGDEYKNRIEHPKIKHLGFVQPNDLKEILENTGAFILPSTFEPWGVVVHEFALSGFPLILSDAVGAGSKFLEPKKNGYYFQSGSPVSLKQMLLKYIQVSDQDKIKFSERSFEMGAAYKTEDWVAKVLSFLEKTAQS